MLVLYLYKKGELLVWVGYRIVYLEEKIGIAEIFIFFVKL